MSDHDRGAYTPQTEEPLSFDARRPTERRPFPMTLVGCVVVLVALIGGVALVYRGGVRGAGEAPRPVGEPVMSVKTAAGPGGDGGDHASGLDLYNSPKATSSPPAQSASNQSSPNQTSPAQTAAAPGGPFSTGPAPTFAPTPEQPTPRIVAHPPSPVATASPTKPVSHAVIVPPSPTNGAPDEAEVAAAGGGGRSAGEHDRLRLASRDANPGAFASRRREGEGVSGARTSTDTASDEAALGRLASRSVDPEPPVEPAVERGGAGAGGAGAVVQIGAFSSVALADKGYADVAGDMSGRMSGKSKHVLALEVNGKTLYRTWLSGFSSRTDAVAFCEALRARNRSCIVKG